MFYLIESIFGKETLIDFRNRKVKIKQNLEHLESQACKNKFKIMVCMKDEVEEKRTLNYIQSMGYTNITRYKTTKEQINNFKSFDLIISESKIEGFGSYGVELLCQKNNASVRVPVVVLDTLERDQEFNLAMSNATVLNKNIMSSEKIQESLDFIVKGNYVNKIRKLVLDTIN